MIADFAEVYGLRLTDVVREYDPAEVVALIAGLSTTRSRYGGRLQGYTTGKSWVDRDYVAIDHRNSAEGLRATIITALDKRKKDVFREWKEYPGRAVQNAKRVASKLAAYRRLSNDTGNYDVR